MQILFYGDFENMKALGTDYLRQCKVARWQHINEKWLPLAWYVPDDVIEEKGLTFMGNGEAYCNRHKAVKRSRTSRKAATSSPTA